MRAPRSLSLLLGVSILLSIAGCGGGGAGASGSGSGGGNTPPSISSISPSRVVVGSSATTLSVFGANFNSGTEVYWNSAALPTTYVSDGDLKAAVPASDLAAAANVQITVSNSGSAAGASAPVDFLVANPTPELASISPQAVTVGDAVTLAAVGTYFVTGAQIQWNGSPLNTTAVNATTLSAQVPADDLTGPATVSVSVSNPGPGGGASPSLPVTIYDGSTRMVGIQLNANDIVWDATHGLIYASVPAANGAMGSVEAIDPVTAKVTAQVAAGSNPNQLSVSSDDSELWVGEDDTGSIQRFALPGLTSDLQFKLPMLNAYSMQTALSLQAAPGSANTAAVSTQVVSVSTGTPDIGGSVMIYDGVTPRSAEISSQDEVVPMLAWGTDASTLYGNEGGLEVMDVDSAGVSLAKTYPQTLSGGFHFDSSTGYLYADGRQFYADSGPVWSPATGDLEGAFDLSALYLGKLCAVDSAQGLVFFVGQTAAQSAGGAGFTIEVFDKSTYRLLRTLVLPTPDSVEGPILQFIRWGNAGLAFTVASAHGSTPSLYIVDGRFVNSTATPDFTTGQGVDTLPNPQAISPQSAVAGSNDVTMTITGTDFTPGALASWDGPVSPPCSAVQPVQLLQTTYVSATELQATIPACYLAKSGIGTITISNGTDLTLSANQFPFTIFATGSNLMVMNLDATSLAWDNKSGLLYAAVGSLDPQYPNSILVLNPATGEVVKSQPVGADPSVVRTSSDGAYLYVGYQGASAVTGLPLPGLNAPVTWSLGSDATAGSVLATDIEPAPGASQTVAVAGSDGAVTIFDNGIARSNSLKSAASGNEVSSLQWGSDASILYEAGRSVSTTEIGDLSVMNVDASGVTLEENDPGVLLSANLNAFGTDILYDPGTGFLYANDGVVVNPANAAVEGGYNSGGLVLPDSSLNTTFILGVTYEPGFPSPSGWASGFGLLSYNQKTFAPIATETLPPIPDSILAQPVAFVRCGGSCLAFAISDSVNPTGIGPGSMLYILNDPSFVTAAPAN
jgi:hypothetical protein